MQLNEYQEKTLITAKFPPVGGADFIYPILGLCGETGEVAEKLKKIIRDKNMVINEEDKKSLKKELGDVLWYLAVLSKYLGLDLEDVAQSNIEKLLSRKERGVIHGSGDDR